MSIRGTVVPKLPVVGSVPASGLTSGRAPGGSAPRPRSTAMSGYQLRNRPNRDTRGGHTQDETSQSHETAQNAPAV
eukprot:1550232-Prymnesium_polylepis.1